MSGGLVDLYANDGAGAPKSSSSGLADLYAGTSLKKPAGGGGLFGFLHSVGHGIESGAGWTGGKLDLAGHDIAAMPTGIYDAAKPLGEDIAHPFRMPKNLGGQWSEFLTHPIRYYEDSSKGKFGQSAKQGADVGIGFVKGTESSIKHPVRDPFQTILNISAIAAPLAGAAARGGTAADAVRAADESSVLGKTAAVGKALARKPLMPTRELHVPTLVKDENGDLQLVHQPVHLVESHAPLARAAQALHDRIVQRSLDANLTAEKPSLTGRYANARVGKQLDEQGRIAANTRGTATHMLSQVRTFDRGVSPKAGQLALWLRSANVLPSEAADFWKAQADAGVNPEQTGALAKGAAAVHRAGLLHVDEGGKVAVDAERFPKLGAADDLVKANQATREQLLGDENLMSEEGMRARKALVADTMRSETARNPETGVREGQGYTNLSISKKNAPRSGFARARSPVIPTPKKLTVGPEATGEGVRTGRIPDNTTAGVARSTSDALRYIATKEHRSSVYRYGSDVKRQPGDVLIADPHALKLNKIPLDTKQLLGVERSTMNTVPEESEDAGVAAALKAKLEDAIPRLASAKAKAFEDKADIGSEAPEGYRWVPRKIAGDLLHETTPRTGLTKRVNDVNSAITAATVYFKLSHIPQRLATDATTSVLNGALTPANIRAAAMLRKSLTDVEYNELAAATGTHGYAALPQEGDSVFGRAARGGVQVKGHTILPGASQYAHRIDSPFRFVNLVHEARKAGITSPDDFRSLIKAAKNPDLASPRQLSVLKRANRVSMMYDGLGPNEQRTIARGLWFYPWTKAAFRFAGHTAAEHPLAFALGGNLGVQGRKEQAKALGALPYYEFGLTPLGGSRVSNISNLSPFTTAGNVLQFPAHLDEFRGNLNPVLAALFDAVAGTNSFGVPENRAKAAFGDLTAPTPEGQILTGFLGRHSDQSKKMFPNSGAWAGTESPLLRALLGQSVPRRVNKSSLHKAAGKWRTINIPVKSQSGSSGLIDLYGH